MNPYRIMRRRLNQPKLGVDQTIDQFLASAGFVMGILNTYRGPVAHSTLFQKCYNRLIIKTNKGFNRILDYLIEDGQVVFHDKPGKNGIMRWYEVMR